MKDCNDLISVIVPVYNVEKYLPRCIESIINQTHKNLEIILVDDGSPDNCGKICDEYAKKDSRIKVIHKENGGQASARNMGLDIAKGEYIGFADSDDYIKEDMYEYLYDEISRYNADIAVCGCTCVRDTRSFSLICGELFCSPNTEVLDTVQTLKAHCEVKLGLAPWNKLYSRKIWEDIRFPICFREDEAVMYKLMARSSKTVWLSKCKYCYVQRNGSSERNGYSEKWLISNKTNDEMYEFIKNNFPELEKLAWDRRIAGRIEQIRGIVLFGDTEKHGEILDGLKDFLRNHKANAEELQKMSKFVLSDFDNYVKFLKKEWKRSMHKARGKELISLLGMYGFVKKIHANLKK